MTRLAHRTTLILLFACASVGCPAPTESEKPAEQERPTATAKRERPECDFGGRPRPSTTAKVPNVERPPLPGGRVERAKQTAAVAGGTESAARGVEALARFDRGDLQAWRAEVMGEAVYRSPRLDPSLGRAVVLKASAAAGSAGGELAIVPMVHLDEGNDSDRRYRTSFFPFPANEETSVRVDLNRLLHHGWNEGSDEGTLLAVEMRLPLDAEMTSLELFDEAAFFPPPAGKASIERRGSIAPGWYVHGGERLQVAWPTSHDRPEGEVELRAQVAASDADTEVSIHRVTKNGEERLHRSKPGEEWRHVRVSIPSDGVESRLELRAEGSGLGFIADLRWVRRAPASTPDVIIYMVDTLVATRLGEWGSRLGLAGVSPRIDRLAREGLTFGHAVSTAPWTKPAIPTVMSGIDAAVHRVGAKSYSEKVPNGLPLVQESFRTAGFRTGSFAANPLGSTFSGLERGFDMAVTPRHYDGQLGELGHPSSEQLQQSMFEWMDQESDLPHFIYLHTLEVHESHRPMFEHTLPGWEPYDNAIRAQNAALVELMKGLDARERDYVLVVVSDHGHAFGDHSTVGHGLGLFESQMHVPLIFYSPKWIPKATINQTVSLVDFAPTLLDLYGLPPLPDAQGTSLLRYLEPGRNVASAPIFASREWYIWDVDGPRWYAAYGADGKKAILRGESRLAYDLRNDPCVSSNIGWANLPVADSLNEWLVRKDERYEALYERYGAATDEGSAADDLERLRALGYIE